MNFRKSFLLLLIISSFIHVQKTNSQSEERPGIGRGTLDSQFNYLIYQSDKLENSRVVKSWWLYNVRNQVKDSLNLLHTNIDSLQNVVVAMDARTDSLNMSLSGIKSDLADITAEKDNIEVFGIALKKAIYNIIMWSLAGILLFILLIFVVMFKRGHVITKEARNDLNQVKDEFEAFRKRALEREREVTRKLYDEVLKYKNKIGAE